VIHLVGGGKMTFVAVSNQAVQRFFFSHFAWDVSATPLRPPDKLS